MGREDRVKIRPARGDEALVLTELALRSKAVWGYDAAFLAMCRAELTMTPSMIHEKRAHVAEADGALVGFVTVLGSPPEGELDALYVEPSWIGAGVGGALLGAAREIARRAGFRALRIHADPRRRLLSAPRRDARGGRSLGIDRGAQPSPPPSRDREGLTVMPERIRVVEAAHALAASIARRDDVAIREALAADFLLRVPGGASVDVAGFISSVRQIPGEIVFVTLDDVQVDLVDATAVVVGVQHARVLLNGAPVDDRRPFVDWFVRGGDGAWRVKLAIDLPSYP